MHYNDVIPTHNSLRNYHQFESLLSVFHKNEAEKKSILGKEILILIVDDRLFLNDGHHRICAGYAAGIDICEFKFRFESYSIKEMDTTNYEAGWVTPYNPYTHVRKNTCLIFKRCVLSAYSTSPIPNIDKYIHMCSEDYSEERKLWSIQDMIVLSRLEAKL